MRIHNLAIAIGNRLPTRVASTLRTDSRFAKAIKPLVNRAVPDHPMILSVRSGPAKGLLLYGYPRQEQRFWTGTHEPHVQQAILDLLKPGDTFWDIGAHIGFFALLASRAVGDGGTVVAFEPMSETRRRLERAAVANRAGNVTVLPYAVSSGSGEAILHANARPAMWSLVAERGASTGERVQCRSLDELEPVAGVPRLVKIDAEGVELDVLRGGRTLLTTHKPIVIVELTDNEGIDEIRHAFPQYRLHHLGQNHWLMK